MSTCASGDGTAQGTPAIGFVNAGKVPVNVAEAPAVVEEGRGVPEG